MHKGMAAGAKPESGLAAALSTLGTFTLGLRYAASINYFQPVVSASSVR